MSIISLPLRAAHLTLSQYAGHGVGEVFAAQDRFTSRAYPVGSWVRHHAHGDGEVIAVKGLDREVRFESMESKDAHELAPDEIPHGVDRSNLVNVAWISREVYSVHASELQLLRKVALPPHQRWAY